MPFEWGAQDSQLCQTHSPVPKQPRVRTANVSHGNDGNSWVICLRTLLKSSVPWGDGVRGRLSGGCQGAWHRLELSIYVDAT